MVGRGDSASPIVPGPGIKTDMLVSSANHLGHKLTTHPYPIQDIQVRCPYYYGWLKVSSAENFLPQTFQLFSDALRYSAFPKTCLGFAPLSSFAGRLCLALGPAFPHRFPKSQFRWERVRGETWRNVMSKVVGALGEHRVL